MNTAIDTFIPDNPALAAQVWQAGAFMMPNVILHNYAKMGISDATAMFLMRLLLYQEECLSTNPQAARDSFFDPQDYPHYLYQLRRRGLLFTRRHMHPKGRVHLEYDLASLFYNARRAETLAEGESFTVELPAEVVAQIVAGEFCDVPEALLAACQEHYAAHAGEPLALPPPENK